MKFFFECNASFIIILSSSMNCVNCFNCIWRRKGRNHQKYLFSWMRIYKFEKFRAVFNGMKSKYSISFIVFYFQKAGLILAPHTKWSHISVQSQWEHLTKSKWKWHQTYWKVVIRSVWSIFSQIYMQILTVCCFYFQKQRNYTSILRQSNFGKFKISCFIVFCEIRVFRP